MELQNGRVIERYEVLRPLGSGAMAEVYLVRHTHLDTRHALKILSLGTGRELRDRMLQEGRLQASLGSHPNVVAVTDVLEVDGLPALLMEYVDGIGLDDWLARGRPTIAEAERIFRGIVAGVAHAHQQGLVHRDLKPGNVMLQEVDGRLQPKVADFGLAKAWDGAGDSRPHERPGSPRRDSASATRPGVAMGTPAYMAPEQIRDASSVDRRADLFALGCILYELLCGRRAFEGEDIVVLFTRICAGEFTPPSRWVPELPPHLGAAIAGCLQPDREARFQDCRELLAALDGTELTAARDSTSLGAATRESTEPRVVRSPGSRERSLSASLVSFAPRALGGQGPSGPSMALVGAGLAVGAIGVIGLIGAATAGWLLIGRAERSADVEVEAPSPEVDGEPEPAPVGEEEGEQEEEEEETEPAAPDRPGACTGPEGELIGYANVRSPIFVYRAGDTWIVNLSPKPVHSDLPNEENGYRPPLVCTLPVGAAVRLSEDPRKLKRAGYWIAVLGGNVTFP